MNTLSKELEGVMRKALDSLTKEELINILLEELSKNSYPSYYPPYMFPPFNQPIVPPYPNQPIVPFYTFTTDKLNIDKKRES